MDDFLAGSVAGALSSETKESILAQELEKLQDKKNQLKEDNTEYVANHPEFSQLLDDFIGEIMKKKPHDIVKFGEKYFNALSDMGSNVSDLTGPKPLIIAGPSGVGKGTIISLLMKNFPDTFGFSVSHTTRSPRAGEMDGVQYHFVDMEHMTREINEGKFIEHALVHTNYYGTSFAAVQNIQDQGKICILDIDVQGVQNVKVSGLECRKIFIAPPTIDELERRLRGRMSESDDRISIRLQNARGEIAYGMQPGNFDAIIVNDSLDTTYTEIKELLRSFYPNFSFHEIADSSHDDSKTAEAEGKSEEEDS